ncbi:MAG TPA: energy-coupled thiamine transporter ThiT [Clostridiales bacterium]|nr:energy-coupled thiamine transporter ThiT [Clostridiales bacterium]
MSHSTEHTRPAAGGISVQALVEAAIMVAVASVLSVVVLFHAPQGGSVTPASMVPLLVLALRRGPKVGLMAGAVYGLIQLWLDPFVVHWAQVILDYPLAFALLGLAGFFPGRPFLGAAAGILGRMVSHVLSGVIFFASYAGEVNPWIYSLAYNAGYLVPELVLSLVVLQLLRAGSRGDLIQRVA